MPTADLPLLSPTLHSVDKSVEKTETLTWEDVYFPETKHISLLDLHPFSSILDKNLLLSKTNLIHS